jgi:hypothetical protein
MIHTPLGCVTLTVTEDTTVDCCGSVYILDKTMSRIRVGEEVEAVVKVASSICVLQSVVV